MSLESEIFAAAQKSEDGHYFLTHKYDDRPEPKWDACRALVESGHARWMSSSSDYAPGIILTGKPLEPTPNDQ